jgi:hypothetical protein
MDDFKTILSAMHEARAVLAHHVQSQEGREPGKAIERLREILESPSVSLAVRQVSGTETGGADPTAIHD